MNHVKTFASPWSTSVKERVVDFNAVIMCLSSWTCFLASNHRLNAGKWHNMLRLPGQFINGHERFDLGNYIKYAGDGRRKWLPRKSSVAYQSPRTAENTSHAHYSRGDNEDDDVDNLQVDLIGRKTIDPIHRPCVQSASLSNWATVAGAV